MIYKIPTLASQPYRPSNGTEGDMFQEQFCARCANFDTEACGGCGDCTVLGKHGMSILGRSAWNNIGEEDYPTEWTHDAEGQPTCMAFRQPGMDYNPDQLGLFKESQQ